MENTNLQIFKNTVIFQENDCIFIQFICDLFEINRENQQRIIQNDAILSSQSTKKSNDLLFNDKRKRLCLTKKGFIRWLQLINPNIVKEELREKLINYQTFIFDYIYGEALVPNIRREYEIEQEQKEINRQVNKLMLEHKKLDIEKKQIKKNNYLQLGLDFFENNSKHDTLKPFYQNELSE